MGVLNDNAVFPILLSTDLDATRAFYRDLLGLEILREDPGDRIVFRCGGGTQLAVTAEHRSGTADTQTQMAWRVPDIRAAVAELRARGVRIEEYEAPDPVTRGRRRGHGPLVGRVVHRPERERPRGRPAEGLTGPAGAATRRSNAPEYRSLVRSSAGRIAARCRAGVRLPRGGYARSIRMDRRRAGGRVAALGALMIVTLAACGGTSQSSPSAAAPTAAATAAPGATAAATATPAPSPSPSPSGPTAFTSTAFDQPFAITLPAGWVVGDQAADMSSFFLPMGPDQGPRLGVDIQEVSKVLQDPCDTGSVDIDPRGLGHGSRDVDGHLGAPPRVRAGRGEGQRTRRDHRRGGLRRHAVRQREPRGRPRAATSIPASTSATRSWTSAASVSS